MSLPSGHGTMRIFGANEDRLIGGGSEVRRGEVDAADTIGADGAPVSGMTDPVEIDVDLYDAIARIAGAGQHRSSVIGRVLLLNPCVAPGAPEPD